MPVTLTITDNADGTGGVATIAGTNASATNVLMRSLLTGYEESLPWETVASRTGDGAINVGGPIRNYYLWQVQSTHSGSVSVSPVRLKALTDASYTAVRTRLINAVVDRLKLLKLDSIGDDVFVRNVSDDPVTKYPNLTVLRDASPDQYTGGTNYRDDVGYPIQVLFNDISDMRTEAPVMRWDIWKERAERAFRNQRIPGVIEVYTCTVEPAMVMGESVPSVYQKVVSSFTIRFVSREVRGLQS